MVCCVWNVVFGLWYVEFELSALICFCRFFSRLFGQQRSYGSTSSSSLSVLSLFLYLSQDQAPRSFRTNSFYLLSSQHPGTLLISRCKTLSEPTHSSTMRQVRLNPLLLSSNLWHRLHQILPHHVSLSNFGHVPSKPPRPSPPSCIPLSLSNYGQ